MTMRTLLGGMLAVLLVSGVAGAQTPPVRPRAQTVSTDTPEIAALRVKANAGDAGAQYNLGLMYGNGQSVQEDYVEGYKWLNLAASRASSEKKRYAETLDVVAKTMTPAQLAKAQKLAREWLAAFEKRGGK